MITLAKLLVLLLQRDGFNVTKPVTANQLVPSNVLVALNCKRPREGLHGKVITDAAKAVADKRVRLFNPVPVKDIVKQVV